MICDMSHSRNKVMTTIAKSALGAAVALWALTAGHAQALTIALANSFSFGGSSYRTYYADQAISWTEARNHALSLGGGFDLVSINSQAENDLIFANINNPSLWNGGTAYGRGGPWIGLFQPAGSPQPAGGWQWVDGTSALSPNYNNWSPGQPDNRSVSGIQVEGYGQFIGDGGWNDLENIITEPSLTQYQPVGIVVEAPAVPGPLPIFGAAAAFGFSRNLRRRIKNSVNPVSSSDTI
jgi:hypothetical protein